MNTVAEASPKMQAYFDELSSSFQHAYDLASQARALGIDPELSVEVAPAADVAARVEGLVGPPGSSERIRELCANKTREAASFEMAREIMEGKYGGATPAERIEQAVRTGLALATEGVVSAPIEGISRIEHRKNPDGSDFIAVVFAGPIRGAGGTGQAIALMLADYCRRLAKIGDYRPKQDEVERAVEELNLYARRTRAGQYVPTEDEIKHIWNSCPVCIDGESSEDYEVSSKRNLQVIVLDKGVEKPTQVTNRVRSGMCLVTSEGVCLKAAKVLRISRKQGLDWAWIEKLVKVAKQEKKDVEMRPVSKYMDEIVAGRPIFSYPMRPGGWRLRYGRTRLTGIAAKAVHPAAMVLLGEFPVIGTQMKVERPGKGCILTPCEGLEPPVAKLANGDVVRVETLQQARDITPYATEILFLGDLLANYGDFSKSNHPLVPSGYCEEWHSLLLAQKQVTMTPAEIAKIGAKQAIAHCRELGVPLAPRYDYFWHDISAEQAAQLANWVCANGRLEFDWFELTGLAIAGANAPEKRILELLCLPHKVADNNIRLSPDDSLALLASLGILDQPNKCLTASNVQANLEQVAAVSVASANATGASGLDFVRKASGLTIFRKVGMYIGSSMGRPEKAKPRKMKPPVNVLFPIGLAGGKLRSLIKAARSGAEGAGTVEVELANRVCLSCGTPGWKTRCSCGGHAQAVNKCLKCGKLFPITTPKCLCGGEGTLFDKRQIDLDEELRRRQKRRVIRRRNSRR